MAGSKIQHLVIIGPMGVGKSTVGRSIAKLLGLRFIDTDELLEEKAGHPGGDLIRLVGLPAFRLMEESVSLDALDSRTHCVIATGGGTILSKRFREGMTKHLIVGLAASHKALTERLSESTRYLTSVQNVSELVRDQYYERAQFYGLADFSIDTTEKSPESVASMIVDIYERYSI